MTTTDFLITEAPSEASTELRSAAYDEGFALAAKIRREDEATAAKVDAVVGSFAARQQARGVEELALETLTATFRRGIEAGLELGEQKRGGQW